MRLTYDPQHNIAYLRLHEKTAEVETIRVSDELNVDMTPDGSVYGIELLNAKEQIGNEENGVLVAVDRIAPRNEKKELAIHEKSGDYAARSKRR